MKNDPYENLSTEINKVEKVLRKLNTNKLKIITFCFTGSNGGKIKNYTKYSIIVPSKETSIIQVIEIMMGQVFCEVLENYFFK